MSGTKRAKDSELGKEIGVQIGGSLLMLVGLAVAGIYILALSGQV